MPGQFENILDKLQSKKISEQKLDLQKITNPSSEAVTEIAEIIDKNTVTSKIGNQEIKHLKKEAPVDKIFKQVKTKGYKRPSVAKEIFRQVLKTKGVTTYDNYRTNKIVVTLGDVLIANKGDVLSIKPSAVAEILPEFAIEGNKGGKGLPAFRTFLNYLEGSQRLAERSGLKTPATLGQKPVSQIVNEMKENFLQVKGGRARGDFKVFNETKLLDKLANENPQVKAIELKKIYEKNGGTSFKERLKNLYLAKTGQVTNKTTGGKSILEAVQTGEITNKTPLSLKRSFSIYGKDYNFGRFTRFASEETDPKKIRYYNDLARKFFTTGAQTKFGTQGLVAEHGLPIAAYDRGVADISVRAKIDGYVTREVNNWKAKNFDFPIFRPGGLADKYKTASKEDKPKIQKQIENKLKLAKIRTPNLVENITFDFTDGVFKASSSTPEINEKIIPELKKRGVDTMNIYKKTQSVKPASEAPIPEKSKIRGMFDRFNERYMSSKPMIQKFSSKIPGSAIALAPYDFTMMLASGAPMYEALGSAGSYFLKDPYLGKAVNVPLALADLQRDPEQAMAKGQERFERGEKFLRKYIPEGIQAALDFDGPQKVKDYFTSEDNEGIVSALRGVK
tara:strand:+ start:937 stop:2793 length:1857 start_codon:yes stop_codon:yes gene_type:complete